MATPTAQPSAAAAEGTAAAEGLRRILADLGADADLVSRVKSWADLGEHGYVYVPPLPAAVVEHLARLLPPGAAS